MDVSQHIWTRRPLSREKLLLRVVGIGLMLISPVAIYYASGYYAENYHVAKWPQVEGFVKFHKTHGSSGTSSKGNLSLYVLYDYEVAGKRYHGQHVRAGSHELTEAQVAKLKAQFPVGSKPQVYYGPSDPSHAFLIPDAQYSATVPLIGSWGLLIGGLTLVAASRPPPLVLRGQETWFEKWFVRWFGTVFVVYVVMVVVINFTATIFLPPPEEAGMTWLQLATLTPIWLFFLGAAVHWIVGRLR